MCGIRWLIYLPIQGLFVLLIGYHWTGLEHERKGLDIQRNGEVR
jgi:hypothetical protein